MFKHKNRQFDYHLNCFRRIWDDLEHCTSRGIYFYNENERKMQFSSYSEIYKKAGILAGILISHNIKKSDRVLLSSKTSMELVYLWLAHIWIGAAVVPMPPRESFTSAEAFKNRISFIMDQFHFYICDENEKDDIKSVCHERGLDFKIFTYNEIFAGFDNPRVLHAERQIPGDDDTIFIQFTSGSTSQPKGIIIRYKNLRTNIDDIYTALEVNPVSFRSANWLPLYHDMGLVGLFLGSLLTLSELVLLTPAQFAKHPLNFMTILSEYDIQGCCMPNFAIEWILRRVNGEEKYNYDLSKLKWIGIGTEPINVNKIREFEKTFRPYGLKKGVVSPCYGLAEATLAVTIAKPFRPYRIFKVNEYLYPTVGRSLKNIEIKIEKENPGDPYGLIKICGNNVASSAYINGKEVGLSDRDGFLNTRDIGFFRGKDLVILGRSDDMFIINGENFFPYEIESYIKELKQVARNRVVCFDIPASKSSSGLVELIVIYETTYSGEDDLRSIESEIDRIILRKTGLKVLKIIAVKPKTILVTPSGKIQRNLMREEYMHGRIKGKYVE